MIEETAQHAAHDAAGHGGGGINEIIMHHVTDSDWSFFIGGTEIYFSKHIFMMWVAGIAIILLARLALAKKGMVPRGVRNFFEVFVVFVRDDIVYREFR